ncbi:Rieske 2Fe-2S domain-containing protein [Burkholderia sp. Ac-20353]|uniref:Rieske (2Fe-2S) protein n=1 Tax=Burkholderia sp. Ac-20353 TaxID=2703894 RepID=UPI00197C7177|nr:Rieske 2Fe-2S domain-containing protein [Burkholderia sp. Ac-20353]MBN3785923.1 Rieske 2Fe-2S domain-containing protein [Burkholderia sp. Ac-20353]
MNAELACGWLCALDDVPDGGALCVAGAVHDTVPADADAGTPDSADVVVLRRCDEAWAYRNVCPHFSIPLNYEPGTFWTYDAQWLMCAHHSAMFRFEDGRCVDGPCEGAGLTAVPVRIVGRQVVQRDQRDQSDKQET